MSDKKELQLTKAAEDKLNFVLTEYKDELLATLSQEKYVPGEDVLEATASDIERAVRRIRSGRTRRLTMRKLQSQVFIVFGIALTAAGLLYPILRESLTNPIQLILLGAGVYLLLGGFFLNRLLAARSHYENASEDELRAAKLERLLQQLRQESRQTEQPH